MAVDQASAPPDQETDVLRKFGAVHRDGADLSEDRPLWRSIRSLPI